MRAFFVGMMMAGLASLVYISLAPLYDMDRRYCAEYRRWAERSGNYSEEISRYCSEKGY